jgi:selenide,water dikinase
LFSATQHEDLIVGLSGNEDASVFRLNSELAIVQTVDFFPPVVDDPYEFGAIAAANALSDVYAMGAKPITALNLVGFPKDSNLNILKSILQGGYEKAKEAGVIIVGGHTIDDPEPKYGLSVTGIIKPGDEVCNSGARPGDKIVITKPIGTGIATTALREGKSDSDSIKHIIESMKTLNDKASEAMIKVGVSACTDITGYGLLGHLMEVLKASKVSGLIEWSKVPVFSGVKKLLDQGIYPGGTKRNLDWFGVNVKWNDQITPNEKLLIADAQTSGGLLITLPESKTINLLDELKFLGVDGWVVGRIQERKLKDRLLKVDK